MISIILLILIIVYIISYFKGCSYEKILSEIFLLDKILKKEIIYKEKIINIPQILSPEKIQLKIQIFMMSISILFGLYYKIKYGLHTATLEKKLSEFSSNTQSILFINNRYLEHIEAYKKIIGTMEISIKNSYDITENMLKNYNVINGQLIKMLVYNYHVELTLYSQKVYLEEKLLTVLDRLNPDDSLWQQYKASADNCFKFFHLYTLLFEPSLANILNNSSKLNNVLRIIHNIISSYEGSSELIKSIKESTESLDYRGKISTLMEDYLERDKDLNYLQKSFVRGSSSSLRFSIKKCLMDS